MEITKIAIIAIIGAVFAILLKDNIPVFSLTVSAGVTMVILFILLPMIRESFALYDDIKTYIKIDTTYIKLLVKSVVIAYISMFSSQLCRDFGQGAIGDKVELGGKVIIMAITAPVMVELIKDITTIF